MVPVCFEERLRSVCLYNKLPSVSKCTFINKSWVSIVEIWTVCWRLSLSRNVQNYGFKFINIVLHNKMYPFQ